MKCSSPHGHRGHLHELSQHPACCVDASVGDSDSQLQRWTNRVTCSWKELTSPQFLQPGKGLAGPSKGRVVLSWLPLAGQRPRRPWSTLSGPSSSTCPAGGHVGSLREPARSHCS